VCGGTFYASELRRQWNGIYACPKDFTLRNPQEFIRPVAERITPSLVLPDDTEGKLAVSTMVSGVASVISASLTDLRKAYTTGTSGTYSLTLPSANDSTYGAFSICLTIEFCPADISTTYVSITSIVPATGTLVGSQTIRPGTIATFRNYPSTNQWVRER
jgi:hypothetical protein